MRSNALSRPQNSRLRFIGVAALILAASLGTACGGGKKHTRRIPPPPPPPPVSQPSTETTAKAKIPPPTVGSDGRLLDYDKDAKVLWTQEGYASWYGPPYHNRKAASGEIFDTHAMTAAHRTLPMNSVVRVTNLKTQSQAVVRINDRGPFVGDRIIDLSMAAAKAVDVWRPGTAKVRVDVLETPSAIENGGRWCVQVGAFSEQSDAIKLKEKLQRRYTTAKVLQFPGPTGFWVRVKVLQDDKKRAQEVAQYINVNEGGVYLVRLD